MCIICSLLVANISYYWYYMRGMIATTYCLFPGPKVLLYYGCIKIHCCIYANLIPYQLVFLGDGLGWCGNSKCKSYISVYFVCHHFYLFYFFSTSRPTAGTFFDCSSLWVASDFTGDLIPGSRPAHAKKRPTLHC